MISVVTASIRPEFLEIVKRCLERQTIDDWEWIVVSPFEYKPAIWVSDPPMREGDFYRLNGAWNKGIRKAEGDLFVSIVDGLWFPPDTLERLLNHYKNNPKSCITCVGNQYDQMLNNKPEHLVWSDPRIQTEGTFRKVTADEMELCIASIPMKAIVDVGGFDEEFDHYAALSEKEMCHRIGKLGYEFYLDQTIEYRAIHHPRLSKDWDKKYFEGVEYYQKCLKGIEAGTRLNLDFVNRS